MPVRPASRQTDANNPFESIGSPVKGLISVEAIPKVLDSQFLDHLTDDCAEICARIGESADAFHERRGWFWRGIPKIVSGWLQEAKSPAVRDVAAELRGLKLAVETFLREPTLINAASAADLYQALGNASLSELQYALMPLPTTQALRAGDHAEMSRLWGLYQKSGINSDGALY